MIIYLIVLYKQTLDTSSTLQSLINCSNDLTESKLIIWDNSPIQMNEVDKEKLDSHFPNIDFINTPENLSLSKIYNIVIRKNVKPVDYLVLLDQDSTFSRSYVLEINSAINKFPGIGLFLPIIKVKDQIVSPAKKFMFKAVFFSGLNKGLIKSRNLMAINSGMVISGAFLKNSFEYDERLKFYGTDNYLMHKYQQRMADAYILDYTINHDLSFMSSSENDKKLKIFKETKQANIIINSDNLISIIGARIYNLLVSIKFSLKYKNIEYLK